MTMRAFADEEPLRAARQLEHTAIDQRVIEDEVGGAEPCDRATRQ
jgi:hypothetical protein